MKKICKCVGSCGKEKELSEFNFNKHSKDGHAARCRECNVEYFRAYAIKNKDKLANNSKIWRAENSDLLKEKAKQFRANNPEKVKNRKKQSRIRNIQQAILTSCRNTAKAKNIAFTLKKEDIIIPEKCPVFGIKLKFNNNHPNESSPSVDRIDNNVGYTKENIIIVSWKANRLKRDSTFEEMTLLYENFNKTNDGQPININLNYLKKPVLRDIRKRINRARIKNIIIPYNLTVHSFNYPTHCPILGLKLDKNIGRPGPNSPSIDRINNKKGYVIGNIRIISYHANELKNNASYKDYKTLYLFYKSKRL